MVARTRVRRVSAVLGAGVRFVLGMGWWLGFWCWFWRLGWIWLAPTRTLRLVPPVVGWIPWAFRLGRPGWMGWRSVRWVPPAAQRNAILEPGESAQRPRWPRDVDGQCWPIWGGQG